MEFSFLLLSFICLKGTPAKLSKLQRDHGWGFFQNGRLARDDPRLSMDDQPTQPASIPLVDPREGRGHLADLSGHDRTDILCILAPGTPAAYRAVELVADTHSHHILQNSSSFKEPMIYNDSAAEQGQQSNEATANPDRMTVDDQEQTGTEKPALDIALRMTSKIICPWFGFTFGRDPRRTDLRISTKDIDNRVSGVHFRIYLSAKGSLMCQDTSTNGTWVDSKLLQEKKKPTDFGRQSTIHDGSTIELMVGAKAEIMRFYVRVPERAPFSQEYGRKLDAYITYIAQMERQKKEEDKRISEGLLMVPPPVSSLFSSWLVLLLLTFCRHQCLGSPKFSKVLKYRTLPTRNS